MPLPILEGRQRGAFILEADTDEGEHVRGSLPEGLAGYVGTPGPGRGGVRGVAS